MKPLVIALLFACPLYGRAIKISTKSSMCAPLTNRGSHFTVEIEVGSPMDGTSPQKLDVVADTGSSAVVVNSCACVQLGICQGKCFQGANHSKSFHVQEEMIGKQKGIPQVMMSFGSGQIQSIVSSDTVAVAGIHAYLEKGVFLLIDKKLQIAGPFEGILGLGIPIKMDPKDKLEKLAPGEKPLQYKSLMKQSGITQYTMCFNEKKKGALRFGKPPKANWLGSMGKEHWGLGLHGISVGDGQNVPAVVCRPGDLTNPGQVTPCGAIPDSGTTIILGPQEGVAQLIDTICDNWPRCQALAKEMTKMLPPEKVGLQVGLEQLLGQQQRIGMKAGIVDSLLMNCDTWKNETKGLDEMPTISFTMKGNDGKTEVVSFTGSEYVLSMDQQVRPTMEDLLKNLLSTSARPKLVETRPLNATHPVCALGLGTIEYNTQKNGPVWVMGTPLFHKYQISYDIGTDPPSMSFAEGPCGRCDETPVLASSGRHVFDSEMQKDEGEQKPKEPRFFDGSLLIPSFDTTRPM